MNALELLRKTLDYLQRGNTGIYCHRDEQGNLHGPETRRFELAEEIRTYLASSPIQTESVNVPVVVISKQAGTGASHDK